ncbi:hypothetical protein L1D44_18700 [Shewanella sp. Isolate13]|uniref:hypothetical protein n=1 Tax=Shewanella sp. Isolate13 TaxID=2908531 RepID=UPI001EFE43EF|nr:hypothetical protein [Shewanella sp. Isolate13]MCG9731821.1 hypothetical protein [Shewanella sp. Isolate13]
MRSTSNILLLVAITTLATPVMANAAKEDVVPTEEQVDTGLKNFGYLTGLALGCVAADQSAQLETEAMNISNEISRTLGGDRAFLYAASFGYGTNIELNQQECTEALANFEKRAAAFQQDMRGEK